ncbi:MAG: MerR family transcriptional regulator [Candidatus Adiutrix sp.]|jgi:DNA-binding transcriptional MerR regulator|nr:MerR family transcriptional regulator [Candidatus Adiutrix sp.]
MSWTVREISELTGISAASLRYYDKEGIISPKRGNNKYRRYDERDLFLIQSVIVLKYAGFSLAEIKSVMEPSGKWPDEECRQRNIDLTKRKCAELSAKITSFKEIAGFLQETLSVLEDNDNSEERLRLGERLVQRNFDRIKTNMKGKNA